MGAARNPKFHCAWFAPSVLFSVLTVLLSACSSSADFSRQHAVPQKNSPSRKIVIPEGWSSVAQAQGTSAGELRLVRNDNSATMVARELRLLPSAKNLLEGEDVCTLGNISMQNKLGNGGNQRRILRPPAAIGNGNSVCVYFYSENSLLRRVLVFRARTTIYEVELLQESASLAVSAVVEAQSAFARSLMNGH